MFNVEPQESWTKGEAAEFEEHAAARLKTTQKNAAKVGCALFVTVLCTASFAEGHSLHQYAEPFGRILVLADQALLVWFGIKVGYIWSAWQSARETRREYGGPL